MDDRDLNPDKTILDHIFRANIEAGIELAQVSIILQTWHKCVFRVKFSSALKDAPPSCVVRLETTDGGECATFATVAAMQEIAANKLPDLVPSILQVGIATNAQNKELQFCVVEFVEGHAVDEVWNEMSRDNQGSVITSLAEALEKLQSIRLSDDAVRRILSPALGEEGEKILMTAVFGGPSMGFLDNGNALLAAISKQVELKKKHFTHRTHHGSSRTDHQVLFRRTRFGLHQRLTN